MVLKLNTSLLLGMTNMKIPVNVPNLLGNEKKYLNECIDTGWISSEGPFVRRFEEGMCQLANRKHGVAVCNGSVALDMALQALELPRGSEVIIPSFTIISCVSAVMRVGCVPVLIDNDPLSWNMDVNLIESKITEKTCAIMAVHIYGLPVNMHPIFSLAKKYGLCVIEDAAEAIGQTYYGEPCGSFGDISCFSFYPNKHITTGEGGMVLCNDAELAERCRSLRNLAFVPERRFMHHQLGYNYRMSNLQAALGVAQLEKLDSTLEKKRYIGRYYQELLKDISGLQLPLLQTDYADNLFWVFGIVLNQGFSIDAQEFQERLTFKGVSTRPFFWPMHMQPVLLRQGLFKGECYPVAENIARRGFYIPSGVGLTNEQMEYVAAQVRIVMEEL